MVKEALVFSTINAGVNRLLNPHHHHYISDSRPASSSTTSETHITYNNHYFNGAPAGNVPAVPPSPSQSGGVSYSNYPSSANYPSPVSNPAITPGVSIPTIVGNNSSVVNPAGNPSIGTTNSMIGSPAVPPSGYPANDATNNQEMSDQWANRPQYRISDGELATLTEELFENQELDVSKYVTLNLQKANNSSNITDEAKEP